ncbi:MAG: DUF1343 domain-containing protein [Phascolarctobacterium sp.]|nr:DUF1343 domain-containing protein [Phascolarctobacterium sp.]
MKKFFLTSVIFMLCIFSMSLFFITHKENKVILGIEQADDYGELLSGKRLGLLTNQTGVDRNLRSSVDILNEKYQLTAIFVPEHGFYGAVAAGERLGDNIFEDSPVFSLYGDMRRPTSEMLDQIDVLCVDLQDIGMRHYTYVSTMAYAMEACAAAGKQVIIFDRPNPLGGKMEGPVLKPEFKSFIGLYEVPLRHGLTIGEYAKFINEKYEINSNLYVIPMKGWHRNMFWQDTGLLWVTTSPLIPTAETAFLYAATGVCGDTGLSVGEATSKPFYYVGAPYVDEILLTSILNKLHLEGLLFRQAAFTPRWGKYEGDLVKGVEIYLLDKRDVNLPQLGYLLLSTIKTLYPEDFLLAGREYGGGYKVDIALGEDSFSKGEEPAEVFARWDKECADFAEIVKPYLLYK